MFCFIFRTNEVLRNLQNKEPRDWQNLFAFTRFRYIEVLFHAYILLLLGKENHSLYRGLRYIEVHCIYVPLYDCSLKLITRLKSVSFCATIESNEALNVKGAMSRLIYGVFSAR